MTQVSLCTSLLPSALCLMTVTPVCSFPGTRPLALWCGLCTVSALGLAPRRQAGWLGQGTLYRTFFWCVNTGQWCPSLRTNHYNFMVLKIMRSRQWASSWWWLINLFIIIAADIGWASAMGRPGLSPSTYYLI